MNRNLVRVVVLLGILVCNVSCDQVSKGMVRSTISAYEEIQVIPHHFTLMKVENTGAFLSLGNNLSEPWRIGLLSVVPSIALAVLLFLLLKRSAWPRDFSVGVAFILGGGFGNLFDRVVHGSVTDFMHMNFVVFQTGIFNMADVSIMIGFVMVAIAMLRDKTLFEPPASV